MLRLEIVVRPRAARDGVAGLHGGRLRVELKAPPVDGRANERLTSWLAREFGVPKRAVRLVRGEKGRTKSVEIVSPVRTPSWFGPLAAPN
jgi:hypothetical protein